MPLQAPKASSSHAQSDAGRGRLIRSLIKRNAGWHGGMKRFWTGTSAGQTKRKCPKASLSRRRFSGSSRVRNRAPTDSLVNRHASLQTRSHLNGSCSFLQNLHFTGATNARPAGIAILSADRASCVRLKMPNTRQFFRKRRIHRFICLDITNQPAISTRPAGQTGVQIIRCVRRVGVTKGMLTHNRPI